jgi:hypothetical protein
MRYALFLDDERFPCNDYKIGDEILLIVIARNYDQAVAVVNSIGLPHYISFDHDLGNGKNGYDFCKYIVEMMIENNGPPDNFGFYVHSQNPIGAKNIICYMENYLKMV